MEQKGGQFIFHASSFHTFSAANLTPQPLLEPYPLTNLRALLFYAEEDRAGAAHLPAKRGERWIAPPP